MPEHLDTLLDTLTTARLNGSHDVDHVDIVRINRHACGFIIDKVLFVGHMAWNHDQDLLHSLCSQ